MDKIYDPKSIEDKNYKFWLDKSLFKAHTTDNKENFSIVIPPPNVTGSLHIGHALNNTLQDILTRYKRMCNFNVLWLPGMDHAGIATQLMVERDLQKNNLTKHDLGRDKFIERVWEWKKESGGMIIKQLRKLGALPDWSRERFTLDEGLSKAVNKVFVDLYNEGLIYKDKKLVNWDPKLCTAISDLEVEQREEKGNYWHIKYPIESSKNSYIVVATTRPETMLGDTAVAVHPDDERYKNLIGKNALLPLVNKKIPIIADEYSDPEKGTGAVKITPAHDFNDFEVGKRHNLEIINIFNDLAQLNDSVPDKYIGLDRFEARKLILKDLEDLGLLENTEEINHTVPYGDRSGEIVEPYLTDQWYVNAKELSIKAIEFVKSEKIKFHPKFWENTYFEWMNNIEPWCISRQIWWGHQIPVWYGPDGKEFSEIDENKANNLAQEYYGKKVDLVRDNDVLDTWFSSGLWPFSTMGWPNDTVDLSKFYPTQTLVTGFDIIFFWVARMIMMGLKFTDEVPFKDVYIHGLIRDEHGQKMSKTKGNVIDPLDVIDKYGADSLRFTLCAMASKGRDIKLSFSVIDGYRNFMNKIWNATRFLTLNLDQEYIYSLEFDTRNISTVDKWILSKFNNVLKDLDSFYSEYEFDKVASRLYHFIWDDYCDWYIELSKSSLYGDDENNKISTCKILLYVLLNSLKALHPISPFITEEIFQIFKKFNIKNNDFDSILECSYPEYSDLFNFPEDEKKFDLIKDVIVGIRSLRSSVGIHPSEKISIYFKTNEIETATILKEFNNNILNLANVSDCTIVDDSPQKSISNIVKGVEIYLPVEGVIDVAKETEKLNKELVKVKNDMEKTTKKLNDKKFLERAPEEIVDKEKSKYSEFSFQKDKLEEIINKLKQL